MLKRIFSIVLCTALVFSAFATMGIIVSAETSDDYEYEILDDGTVGIIKYKGSASVVSIPSIIADKTVTIINSMAFFGCKSLNTIEFSNSITNIDKYAFYFCDSLQNINVSADNKNYSSENGVLFNKNKTELIKYPEGKTDNTYTIPDGVSLIGDWAFGCCDRLTSITIPDSVTSIGAAAFEECTSLTSIVTHESIKSIGQGAFKSCESLTSITIPNSVTSIGDYAFARCKSLASITIPDSVANIGGGAFESTAYYSDESNWEDGVLYIGNHLIKTLCSHISDEYVIRTGTKTIAGSCFTNNTSLYTITIPDSVTSIGDRAFLGCESLESITIPTSVTLIGKWVFNDCDSLTIQCYKNSVAHDYAIENSFDFELLITNSNNGKSYGDCNADTKINMADVLILRKYLAKWDVLPNLDNSDCNADTKINMADVLILRKYLAKWDVILGNSTK